MKKRQTYLNKPALWETNPELAAQLVDPQDGWRLTTSSNKKALWACDKGHEWETTANERSRGKGCPYCSGQKVSPDTCLAAVNPELASQLVDQSLATQLTVRSGKKVSWRCEHGHEWEAPVANRSKGIGCPYCSGRRVTTETCLATVNPELASQLVDQSLATQLTNRSGRKVWWRCDKGHEWEAQVVHRSRGAGCPYCSGRRATTETCLATVNPELASQMVDKSLASKLTEWSNEKVMWRCECGHEWEARVCSRSKGCGCPVCASSRMNKWSAELCNTLGLDHRSEWRTEDCRNKNPLPFDLAILGSDGKPLALCEFQGKQHFESVKHWGGDKALASQKKRDKIKRDYCEANGIPLIEVHYSQRDFKNDEYGLSEWFRQYILTELHTLGVIGWATFSKHSKPYEPAGEPSQSSFLPRKTELTA